MITQGSDKTKWRIRRERNPGEAVAPPLLAASQIDDLRLAAAQMTGAARRAFQAEMTLKYCQGSARFAETLVGWSREAVEVGLAERRTGILCVGAQAAWSGRNRWEEKYPEAGTALRELAEAHAQQDPTFRTTLAYTPAIPGQPITPQITSGYYHAFLRNLRVLGKLWTARPHGIIPSPCALLPAKPRKRLRLGSWR